MHYLKNHFIRILLSLVITGYFVAHHMHLMPQSFIQTLEDYAYDYRLAYFMPNSHDEQIVIIDVDEKSLNQIGHWPWNRAVMSQLMDQLFDHYKINILGVDMVFSEADQSSGLQELEKLAKNELKDIPLYHEKLEKLRTELNYDERFAQSLKDRRVILGYIFTNDEADAKTRQGKEITIGKLGYHAFNQETVRDNGIYHFAAYGYIANLSSLQENALDSGHFNSSTDSDGVVRRVPLLYGYDDRLYEALPLTMMRYIVGAEYTELAFNEEYSMLSPSPVLGLHVGRYYFPVDQALQMNVPYRGEAGSFTYLSAVDVINGKVDKSLLHDKYVFLGTTAQGLLDLRATPVGRIFPGVEIHANVLSSMLEGRTLATPPELKFLELLFLLITSVIMIFIIPLFSPKWAAVLTVGIISIVVGSNFYAWHMLQIVYPLTATLLLIIALFIFNMSYGFIQESYKKTKLNKLFGQYIPPELVDEMNADLSKTFTAEAESRELTVLFSDVRGFTTISEGLDSKSLSALMNEFLTPMTQVIHNERGTIDKYMGDAIMAFWGAPVSTPNHAEKAVLAAISMLDELKVLQAKFKARNWPHIDIGIGINTGMMSVGNMGSEFRMAYTVLGDAVNLGSRLEGLTKQYQVQLIISEYTRAQIPTWSCRELDRVRVKGKDTPVTIFEPIGITAQLDEHTLSELQNYHDALNHYHQRNWQTAHHILKDLAEKYPDCYVYQLYLERLNHILDTPPPEDWDGVCTFTTK